MMYVIEQIGDVSVLPESWAIQRRPLSPNQRHLYETLIKAEYGANTAPLTDRLLCTQASISSRNALYVALKGLETMEFLSLFEDEAEGVTYITVTTPPSMSEAQIQVFDTISAKMAETHLSMALKLTRDWQAGWEKLLKEPYTITHKDKGQALRLVKNEPDWDSIISVIKWYWRYGYDDERISFANFCTRFNEWSQRKSKFEGNLE